MSNLWERKNYSSGTHFIIDGRIREFDITKANISVLRDANVISDPQYQYLLSCPKQEREITIGKMQGADKNVTKILSDGIANARKIFMLENGINDSEVLSIRNDAITITGNRRIKTLRTSDRISFRQSGEYTSYFHVNSIDLFYFYDRVTNSEVLDVKGLGKASVELHKKFMLEFFSELFYRAQIDGVKEAIKIISLFYSNYLNKKLSIGYYRELNPQSMYRLSKSFSMYDQIYSDYLTDAYKSYVDIAYNESVLRQLNQMLSSVYFSML